MDTAAPTGAQRGSSGGEPAGLSTLIWWQWPCLSSFVVPGGQLLEEITETKFWTKINHMQSRVLWECSLMCLGKDPNTNWRVRHRRLCWGSSFPSSRSALHPFLCPGRLTQSAWRASLQLWDPGTSSYVQPMQTPAETRDWGGAGYLFPLSPSLQSLHEMTFCWTSWLVAGVEEDTALSLPSSDSSLPLPWLWALGYCPVVCSLPTVSTLWE